MQIEMSDAIAVAAIIVSVLTAGVSLNTARNTAKRQQSFELRLYRLNTLDPAKGTLRRIVTDSDRLLNDAILVSRRPPGQKDLETLAKLDREAVDTFQAISHHLPTAARDALDTMRTGFEKKWLQHFENQRSDPKFPVNSNAYMKAVLQAVEDRLRELLDNA